MIVVQLPYVPDQQRFKFDKLCLILMHPMIDT